MASRLDPRIRWVWLVGGLLVAAIPIVAAVILAIADVPSWVLWSTAGLSAALLAHALIGPVLRYRAWSYELTEIQLILAHGVVTKVERRVPRARLQYVDVTAGPIDRALGLATLVVYTAGSGLRSASIPGLARAEAERLRSELLSWTTTPDES